MQRADARQKLNLIAQPAALRSATDWPQVEWNDGVIACLRQMTSSANVILFTQHWVVAALAVSVIAGCGGGNGSVPAAPAAPAITLGGTAAAGFPIVGGAVTVRCAGGSDLTTTTSAAGAWTVTTSGQTLPCAIQLNNGTINGVANSTSYQSLALAAGTINITPLTDLLTANVLGVTTPGTTFGTLTPAQIAAIASSQVSTALTNLKTALGLTALNTIDPITIVFNATPGVAADDILAALRTAITSALQTYASLLAAASYWGAPITLVGQALFRWRPPARLSTAMLRSM